MPPFSPGKVARVADLEFEIPHGFHQFHIVLPAPYQNETKHGRRRSHSTWYLVDLWTTFLALFRLEGEDRKKDGFENGELCGG